MPSRNSLCPCGSGKKYKKCCGLKNAVPKEKVVEEELHTVLQKYFENPMESISDIDELECYEREWHQKLKRVMSRDMIQELVLKYFLFIARRDLWKRYLLKIQNRQIRSVAKDVLVTWQNSFVLFGTVTMVDVDSFEVTEVLGHDAYTLAREKTIAVQEGELVFGIVLSDRRAFDDGVFLLSVQTISTEVSVTIRELIVTMAKDSEQTTSYDFFKAHMLDIYSIIYSSEYSDDDFFGERINEHEEVLLIVKEELQSRKVSQENIHAVKMFGEAYLVKEMPNFRKPAVVAAAIVTAAVEFGILPIFTGMSKKELAEIFGVSVTAMMNHVRTLEDVLFELMLEENVEEVVYLIGTYPQFVEEVQWELFCKAEARETSAFNHGERDFFKLLEEPFEPKNKKQQAQAIAYQAYDEANKKIKSRLTKEVLQLDPDNIDGLLLLADCTNDHRKVEEFYEKAIKLGRIAFGHEEEAWLLVTNRPYLRAIYSYGVWLYEKHRLLEAATQFETLIELDEEDPLYSRYLLISSYIYMEQYDKAVKLLNEYKLNSCDEAAYRYLRWFVEEARTEGESVVSEQFFNDAVEANVFVLNLLEKEGPALPYPKCEEITAGSIEEANYIWTLIGR